MQSFDYIIVGAGSAGCVLAARLSEDTHCTVLLLEAGGPDIRKEIHVPVAFPTLYRSQLDWNYETERQPRLNGRRLYWPRGRVMGGSSSINAMIYIRGHWKDYEQWRELGNPGWGYADVLPYFMKAENNERGASDCHGEGGPLNVADLRSPNPLSRAFVEGAAELGLPINPDFNRPEQLGFGFYQVTQKKGQRHSASKAYLPDLLWRVGTQGSLFSDADPRRPNLNVYSRIHATRILIESGKATGIETFRHKEVTRFHANREVILCGGAVNSPQVLLLSGIGPALQLGALGIPVVVDLPGVGENLQDHPAVDAQWACRAPVSLARAEDLSSALLYLAFRRGPLTSNVAEAGGFVCTRSGNFVPDIQFHFAPVLLRRHYEMRPTRHGFSCCVTLLNSPSRGRIALRSADPFEAPSIDPDYLADAADWASLREGIRQMRSIAETRAFARFGCTEVQPGPAVQSDETLDEFLRARLETLYHPVGTCKMGRDENAVVDAKLRVHGVAGLRVVDASVMPVIPSGNTNAPVIMIAEKAAEMIRYGA